MIRGPAGEWIIGFAKGIGVCAVVDAELWGIYIGLTCAWNLSISGVVVETDCLEALNLIRQGRNGKGSHGLVLHIMELCTRFQGVCFQHVKRNKNRVADRMAKLAIFDGALFSSSTRGGWPWFTGRYGRLIVSQADVLFSIVLFVLVMSLISFVLYELFRVLFSSI
ncbi:hypothetical protein GQ457_16G001520 [Hibiscus cannabinus]